MNSLIKYLKLQALFVLFLFLIFQPIFGQEKQSKYKLKKVVIDAGHGGKDPGAIGKLKQEKEIVLSIALLVGGYIEKYIDDVEVIYTRKTDVFVPLDERAQIANSKQADIFISIHANANDSKSLYGTETYVMGINKSEDNLAVAELENSVILIEDDYTTKYEGYNPSSPESYIMFSLVQNIHLDQSLMFAGLIQDQFRERAGRKDRGVKQAGLVVLWMTNMPSVLVETGFISNRNEEVFLSGDYGQSIIASAIFRAFRDYKNQVESKASSWIPGNISVFDQHYTVRNTKSSKNVVNSDVQENTQLTEFKQVEKGNQVIFHLQIKSSPKAIEILPENFKGINNVQEIKVEGVYKYVVGATANYNEIVEIQSKIKKLIPDAFVIAFKNGERVSIDEALSLSND